MEMTEFRIKENYDIEDFRKIMAILRAPGGCPWDAEQTHESIRRNVIEEAYELAHAIDTGDMENLREELGDLLMQVVFHSCIEEEKGNFDLNDVADVACKKLVFRHPHVFGDVVCENSKEVLKTWDEVKRVEKAQKTVTSTMEGVAETLPALWRAEKVQKKAADCGFEWPDVSFAMMKVDEEFHELQEGILADNKENIEEEIGDLLYTVVNVARHCGVDPETALHKACDKSIRRFRSMEEKVIAEGKKLEDMSVTEMEKYYQLIRAQNEGKEMKFYLDNQMDF